MELRKKASKTKRGKIKETIDIQVTFILEIKYQLYFSQENMSIFQQVMHPF